MVHMRTQRLRRIGLAALAVSSVAGSVLAVGLATPASASVAGLVINEVESNGDATDWIELYNPTGSAINMTGSILADNDNSHAFPLSGTIAAGGYAVFDVSVGTGNFGLGGADSARLFDGASTSASLVDTTSWASHAGTTWGRLPNGSGGFGVTGASTRGALNVAPGGIGNIDGVVINEVESDADATNGDWVELHNPTGSAIDISGALITDDDPGHVFTVPASTSLPANGYAAFRVDDPLVTGNFGLGAADEVKLFQPGDVTFSQPAVDSFLWSVHAVETYGRDWTDIDLGTGLGTWKPTSADTHAAENDQFTPGAAPVLTGVIINEVKTTGDDVNGDWIELHNTSGSSRTIAGAILADDNDAHALRIPAGTPALAANAIAAFRVDDTSVPGNFGLGDADAARLFASDTIDLAASSPVSTRTWTQHGRTSLGWNGSSFVETRLPTFGTANDFSSAYAPDASWVVLNEVESSVSGGQDFVELKNTAAVSIDISGMILSDSDDSHVYAIPASTTLAAGGLYVVEVDNAAVTGANRFGLGSDDAIRLYRSGATVGSSIPLDHHEWTAHAAGTYSRTLSGLGPWVDCTSTKNAANAC